MWECWFMAALRLPNGPHKFLLCLQGLSLGEGWFPTTGCWVDGLSISLWLLWKMVLREETHLRTLVSEEHFRLRILVHSTVDRVRYWRSKPWLTCEHSEVQLSLPTIQVAWMPRKIWNYIWTKLIYVSLTHKLELSERREAQVRKCHHKL